MATFREENRFLIYMCSFFGLYILGIESLISNKCVTFLLSLWSKMPITVFPVYIAWDVRAMLFDEMSFNRKFALFRKVFVFMSFLTKNIIFHLNRRKIEDLFDQWDDSFKGNFYPRLSRMYKEANNKRNKKIVTIAVTLSVCSAISYSVPNFFSQKKVFNHPSGIVYPHRSPEFELAVSFDTLASLCAVSTVAYDCLFALLIAHVRSKVDFLRETLADIIDELLIDKEGRLLARRIPADTSIGERYIFPGAEENHFYEERKPNSQEFDRNMKNAEDKLRVWIMHHQQIIAFLEKLKQVYTSTTTFQLCYTVVYTVLTALHVAQVKLTTAAFSVALVATSNLSSLFLWCWIAGELRSNQIFSEGFSRAWFFYPKKMKHAFSIIAMRSKKPLTIYGIYIYSIDLVTFFEILKLTYQFFAFMINIVPDENVEGSN